MFMHKYPELDELDFEILILLKESGPLTEQEIVNHFAKWESEDIRHRLEMLAEIEPYHGQSMFLKVNSYESGFLLKDYSFKGEGVGYGITARGRVAVVDYVYRKAILHKEKRSDFLWRAVTIFAAILGALGALGAWREEIIRFFHFLFG